MTFSLSFAIVALAIVGAPCFLLLAWQRRTIRRLEAKKILAELVLLDELPGPELRVIAPDEIAPRPPSPPPNRRNVGRSFAFVSGATALMILVMAIDMAEERSDTAAPLPSTDASAQTSGNTATTISLASSQSEGVHVQPSTSGTPTTARTASSHSPEVVTRTVTSTVAPPKTTTPVVVTAPAVNVTTAVSVPTTLSVVGKRYEQANDNK